MAVPRPVLLALLGLALCAAGFLATRGARDPGGAVNASPAPVPAAPAAKSAAPAAKPAEAKRADSAPKAKPRTHEGSKPAAPAKPQRQAPAKVFGSDTAAAAKAAAVLGAYKRGDVVVFFFTHPGAADDTGTRQAVKALAGVDHVTVVRAGLKELTAYRSVLTGAGVSQVPAVVVARADKPAHLLEGYVDGRTLRQTVADALR